MTQINKTKSGGTIMSKIDIDKFVEHLVKLGVLDCNAVQSALFAQGLILSNYKIQKIGENSPDPQFGKPIEQNPAEWSKEDESIVLGIEQIVNCASLLNIAPDKLDKVRNWLKLLKDRVQPQNKWKPSDEQVEALEQFISEYKDIDDSNRAYPISHIIESLYNDLKKLKGE